MGIVTLVSKGEEYLHRCRQEDRTVKEVWEGRDPNEWRYDLARDVECSKIIFFEELCTLKLGCIIGGGGTVFKLNKTLIKNLLIADVQLMVSKEYRLLYINKCVWLPSPAWYGGVWVSTSSSINWRCCSFVNDMCIGSAWIVNNDKLKMACTLVVWTSMRETIWHVYLTHSMDTYFLIYIFSKYWTIFFSYIYLLIQKPIWEYPNIQQQIVNQRMPNLTCVYGFNDTYA